MRKIQFDEETIESIRSFIAEGHTLVETMNRFTLKSDTLRRVMKENNIECFYKGKRNKKARYITENPVTNNTDIVSGVCSMFRETDTRAQDICTSFHISYEDYLTIIRSSFTEQEISKRKSRIYRNSRLGDKNPMFGKHMEENPNWKGGICEDGKGYVTAPRPEWYTGRKNKSRVYVHQLVICEALGLTEFPKGFVVHHINGNKKDNRVDNLALMTMSAHAKLHSLQQNLSKVQRLSDNGVADSVESCEAPGNDCEE